MRKLSNIKMLSDNKGVAAIEFAILLPFLVMILYGVYTVADNIMVSRKVDNAANDIGFLMSRLGRIANNNVIYSPPGCTPGGATPCTVSCNSSTPSAPINQGCAGGASAINNIVNNIAPLLLYPRGKEENFATVISFVGMPINPNTMPNSARVMWSHGKAAVGGAGNICAQVGFRGRILRAPGTTTVNGVSYPTSTYAERFENPNGIDRATLVFPGQTFITTSVRYKDKGFSSSAPADDGLLKFFGTADYVRHSTYATRSAWVGDSNGNNQVDAAEFVNSMQYCTDCNIYSSATMNSDGPLAACGSTTNDTNLRARCVANPNLANYADKNASGCKFN